MVVIGMYRALYIIFRSLDPGSRSPEVNGGGLVPQKHSHLVMGKGGKR